MRKRILGASNIIAAVCYANPSFSVTNSAMPFNHPCGAHERHLVRRRGNPLFAVASDEADLAAARERDAAEAAAFNRRFQQLLQRAAALRPNEESEVLLQLKGELDEAYTYCRSLAGDRTPLLRGLERLTAVIMEAVRRGAAGDAQALAELEAEATARESHYQLLAQPLVADLMRRDSPVAADELVPTLLSAGAAELDAALWLFDDDQLAALCRSGRALLAAQDAASVSAAAWANLERMQRHSDGHAPEAVG